MHLDKENMEKDDKSIGKLVVKTRVSSTEWYSSSKVVYLY
jgi:hypothetical protein